MSAVIDQFMADNTARIRTPDSRATYRNRLRQTDHYFDEDLLDLDGPSLVSYLTSQSWAPATVGTARMVLQTFYTWATRQGLVDGAIIAHLADVRLPRKGVREHKWLAAEEVSSILAACPTDLMGRRDKLVVTLGCMTGLRNREICDLRWDRVDTRKGELTLQGKGQKWATVGLSDQLRKELIGWRTYLLGVGSRPVYVVPAFHHHWESAAPTGGEDELFVKSEAGVGPQTVRKIVSTSGDRVGIAGLCPHDMRRSLAGILQGRGMPLDDIQKVLRHSSVATTQQYLADNPAKAVELMQGFAL